MYKTLKWFFFKLDPEFVHDFVSAIGKLLGSNPLTRGVTRALFDYKHPALAQTIAGIHFANPIGLAAGFDKNAQLTTILPSVGFGFEEVGSVTGEPCPGNPRPRLWRLPESKSLNVYYGLYNDGAEAISRRLAHKNFEFPLGVSVAKTNSAATVSEAAGIADYLKAYRLFVERGVGDYYTINISCPNAYGGEPFVEAGKLDRLLTAIRAVPSTKPIFIKMPAELSEQELDEVIIVARKHKITGFISTNLAKHRDNPNIKDANVPTVGGMSGKVVEELSNKQIAYIYKKTGREFVIVGCGGVFSAADAYKKIRLGASLVQLITGMIYEGPALIGRINKGLVELLERDGYSNISQAVGVDTH